MNIGYACLTLAVPNSNFRTCTIKNASDSVLLELIGSNLDALETIIDYNIVNGIRLFRITSDLIPFGSHDVNTLPWWDVFECRFQSIGKKILDSGMRVSMHPGQYTVLNSPTGEIALRAVDDLKYHTRVLDSVGVGPAHKIVLHVGGAYDDRIQAIDRFIKVYNTLDDAIKQRLVIENDDRTYKIDEVLDLGIRLNIPVVFDTLHHATNHSDEFLSDAFWIDECGKTWHAKDGNQKIHYSQQDPLKKSGSHSSSVKMEEFLAFTKSLKTENIDIMLEVKDKNLSAIKCINLVSTQRRINALESEWSRYKYSLLEKSPSDYGCIRNLLNDKSDYPVLPFYRIIEDALSKPITIGASVNAVEHVWGYFKDVASDKERKVYLKMIQDYRDDKIPLVKIKKSLWRLAVKYQRDYLLSSYYFVL